MNYFKSIKLDNFRNFDKLDLSFNKKCNLIVGANGSGKTNLLESISLFEKGRGFRKDHIKNMINKNNSKNKFIIDSFFNLSNAQLDLKIYSERDYDNFKKNLLINGSRTKESIDNFNNSFSVIWFLPEMERLFVNSPSIRRSFFDRLIYGTDKNYLGIINSYRKKILERSKILKENYYDVQWIKQVEEEITDIGLSILLKRQKYIDMINQEIINLNLIYPKNSFKLYINDPFFEANKNSTDIKNIYLNELKNIRNIDAIIGGCKIGPHKSDVYGIYLSNKFNLEICSTGQQKSIVIMIILAHCKLLIKVLKGQPVILFDEVCSHLDEENKEILLDLINTLEVQTFMTGVEKNSFSFLSTLASYYYIK